MPLRLLALVWLLATFPKSLSGQETCCGAISGSLLDPRGHRVLESVIRIYPSGRTAYATPTGTFSFDSLPLGIYRLVAENPWYESGIADSVEVLLHHTTKVAVRFSPARVLHNLPPTHAQARAEGFREMPVEAVQRVRAAPETLLIQAKRLILSADAWLNLMPPYDAECKIAPLRVVLAITTADSTDLPPRLLLDSAWVVGKSRGFAAAPATFGADLSAPSVRLSRRIWGGPWWVREEPVYLVVEMLTGDGQRHLLRSPLLRVQGTM